MRRGLFVVFKTDKHLGQKVMKNSVLFGKIGNYTKKNLKKNKAMNTKIKLEISTKDLGYILEGLSELKYMYIKMQTKALKNLHVYKTISQSDFDNLSSACELKLSEIETLRNKLLNI
jgi:hypothetical protein